MEYILKIGKNRFVSVTSHGIRVADPLVFAVSGTKHFYDKPHIEDKLYSFLCRDHPKWISKFRRCLGIGKVETILY